MSKIYPAQRRTIFVQEYVHNSISGWVLTPKIHTFHLNFPKLGFMLGENKALRVVGLSSLDEVSPIFNFCPFHCFSNLQAHCLICLGDFQYWTSLEEAIDVFWNTIFTTTTLSCVREWAQNGSFDLHELRRDGKPVLLRDLGHISHRNLFTLNPY